MPFRFGGLRELIDGEEVGVGLLDRFVLWKLGAIYLADLGQGGCGN